MKKFLVILIVIGLFAGGYYWFANSKKANTAASAQPKTAAPVPVLIAKAEQKDFDVEITSFGHVSSYNQVAVKPRVSGHILSVHFKEGQEVAKGDLLFKIDPRKTEASLEQAQATLLRDEAKLTNAIRNFERAKQLLDKSLISTETMDSVTTEMETAKATVASDKASVHDIQLSLEFTDVTAPISGRTGSIQTDQGNVVSAGSDTLVSINEITPISVHFSISEKFMSKLQKVVGQPNAVVNAYDGTTDEFIATGILDFMDNHVDRTTGMVALSARFENKEQNLWPGQFVKVVMTLEKVKDAIVVPTTAVQTGQENQIFIYVVKEDNSLEIRNVTVGKQRGLESVITEGIAAGETVVTDGQLRLNPQSIVKPYSNLDEAVQNTLNK